MESLTLQDQLPPGFSLLRDIDPTILQSPRYFTSENFVGRPLPGYEVGELCMTTLAAEALRNVNTDLKKQGY